MLYQKPRIFKRVFRPPWKEKNVICSWTNPCVRRHDKLLKDKLLKDNFLKRQTPERQTPDETNS